MAHISVLMDEVLTGLEIQPNDVVVDGTINGAGHSSAIGQKLGTGGVLVGIDLDNDALKRAEAHLAGHEYTLYLKQGSFRTIDVILKGCGISHATKILLDLGLSSNQFDESGRGFSFQKDEPLLMTFNNTPGLADLTAHDIVNKWDEENIAQIIESYGEERYAKKIAAGIVFSREHKEITTAKELAELIKEIVPTAYRNGKIHPATKTFQALRITVNDEIGALKEVLQKGFEKLATGGRMAVISFHSIEDRIVKNFFRDKADLGQGMRITKKPIAPTRAEVLQNPRARSSKLRIIQKN